MAKWRDFLLVLNEIDVTEKDMIIDNVMIEWHVTCSFIYDHTLYVLIYNEQDDDHLT